MRRISLEKAITGMILAKSIYTEDGMTLLAKGIELRKSYLDRLELCNVTEIYIEDDLSQDIEVHDVIEETTRNEAKALIYTVMNDYKKNQRFNSDGAKIVVNQIIDELLSSKNILVNLSDIKTVDSYTFAHSVNVCVLSLIIGIKLGLNQLKLRDLGIGALLHDIGKVTIPQEVLQKPGALTSEEYELIKKHTLNGYEILRSDIHMCATSSYVALGHHERCDGSGYPLGAKSDNIHVFARITAIADVYDALTSDRVYRGKMKTHEAIEYFISLGSEVFDKEILEVFIKSIPMYSIGTCVLLDTGEKGIVVNVNSDFPARPIVRIVYGADGARLNDFIEKDLTRELSIFIVDTCDL